jgi:hypothetical protein
MQIYNALRVLFHSVFIPFPTTPLKQSTIWETLQWTQELVRVNAVLLLLTLISSTPTGNGTTTNGVSLLLEIVSCSETVSIQSLIILNSWISLL